MKILGTAAIFLLLMITISCFKSPSSNASQSGQNSSANSSTSNGTSVSGQPASSATGDYSKGLAAYNVKNYQGAVDELQAVVSADPKNFDARYYLGKSLEGLKKYDEAIDSYKEAIKLKPTHADANYSVGMIYYNRKSFETSLPFIDQAAKTDFKSPKTLLALGDNQRHLMMYDRAIVQYGKVIGFEPNNAEAYYGLGLTYIGLKNKIGARQQLQKLEPLNKDLAKKLSDQINRQENEPA